MNLDTHYIPLGIGFGLECTPGCSIVCAPTRFTKEEHGINISGWNRSEGFEDMHGLHEHWSTWLVGWDWVMDEQAAEPYFRHAVELGINFFDTADSYSDGHSEEITGRQLRVRPSSRDDRR